MAEWISQHPEPFFLLGIFILSAVGGLIIWELRKLHTRIDKYSEKMDKHIDDSAKIQRELGEVHTSIDMHIKNGHSH